MFKIPRQNCTAECKREAVKMVEAGRRLVEMAKQLGVGEQTLINWRKAAAYRNSEVPFKPIATRNR